MFLLFPQVCMQLAMAIAAQKSSAQAEAEMSRYQGHRGEDPTIIDVEARFVDDVPQLPAPATGSAA